MDANKPDLGEEDEQTKRRYPPNATVRTSTEVPSPLSASRRSSLDSQVSGFATDADVDLLPLDMDATADGYRRRRAQLMGGYQNGSARGKQREKRPSRRQQRQGIRAPNEDRKHAVYSSDDGHTSDLSSISASDDVELSRLTAEDSSMEDEETGLTKKDRSHRKRRRRKTTQLDERIAGSARSSKQEQKLADRNVLKALIINALLIASWYLFSLSISIYNKWMFSPKYLDFHFPLFTTCLHMLVQFCLASLVLYFIPRLRPRSDSISNPQNHFHVRQDTTHTEKPLMTRMFYLTRISPCGAATGLDIGLGNMSLKFITLTFYTMCKSSSLAFVLAFAFLFRLESPSIRLILIIATMTIGVVMMVAGEAAFDALGFILVIMAAFFSGFRWALTQILLLRNPATSNPFSSIFFLAPVMFLSLAIIAIPVEGFGKLGEGLKALIEAKGVVQGIGILVFPGMLAFLMTSSEFALLQRTSVVTLSICGIFKEVVTITAAGIVFHDPLTPINISGLLVTIASIAGYNYIKITKMRNDARLEAEGKQVLVEEGEDLDSADAIHAPRESRQAKASLDVPNGKARAASKGSRENE